MTAVLIKNADVYAPEHLGTTDVFIVNDKIVAVGKDLTVNVPGMETVDAKGRVMMPGVIDQHIHVTGGGGEAGPVSRCPEASLHEFIEAGNKLTENQSIREIDGRSFYALVTGSPTAFDDLYHVLPDVLYWATRGELDAKQVKQHPLFEDLIAKTHIEK